MAKGSLKLSDLPDDDSKDEKDDIDPQDLSIMNEIFKKDKKALKHTPINYALYATAIFIILSTPFTDRIIELAFPLACSWLILLGTKAVAFFLAFYIILTSMVASKRR